MAVLMVALLLGLFAILLWKVKLSPFHEDYLSPHATNSIKGIFAIIILFSHMRGYLTLPDSLGSKVFLLFLDCLGQAMVAMYLFYSGFGILESIRKKSSYMDYFFRNRICKTLIHFDLAVAIFVVSGIIIGKIYPVNFYVTCWIGWNSVGNSNWFIFDILALYLGVLLISKLCRTDINKENEKRFLCLLTLYTAGLWAILYSVKHESYWVDTLMTFPLGMWYSHFKDSIDKMVRKTKYYYPIFATLSIILSLWRFVIGVDMFGFFTCGFALWMSLLTMKIKFDNIILQKIGTLAFSIYILQRLPMNILEYYGINGNIPLFVCLSICCTFILAHIFNKMLCRVDSKIVKQ